MKLESFVKELHNIIAIDNLNTYKDLFENTPTEDAVDPHWVSALTFYKMLNKKDKEVLLGIVEQTIVDSISSMLAILDGNTELESIKGDLELTVKGKKGVLNGQLQDMYLAHVEELH